MSAVLTLPWPLLVVAVHALFVACVLWLCRPR